MALEVLAGPGCDDVGKEAYIADKLGPDDVVISVGRIFKALTLGADVPSTNTAGAPPGARAPDHGDPLRTRAAVVRIHSDRQRQPRASRQAGRRSGRVSGDRPENDRGAGVRGRPARGVRC